MRVRVCLLVVLSAAAIGQKAKMTMEEYRNCVERRGASACMEENLGIAPGSMGVGRPIVALPEMGLRSGTAAGRPSQNGPIAAEFSRPVYNLEPDWQVPVSSTLPSDFPRWRFAHTNASALVGVKVKQVAASNAEFLKDILKSGGTRGDDLQAVMESLSQLDELWMSIQMAPGRQPSILILAAGQIPETATDHIRASGVSVRYVDSGTIIMGARAEVNAAVARLLAKSAGKAPREDWAESDLMFSVKSGALESFSKGARIPAGVTRLSASMSLRGSASVRAALETVSPVSAKRVFAEMGKDPAMRAMLPAAPDATMALSGNSILASGNDSMDKPEVRSALWALLKPVVEVGQQISARKKTAVIVGLEGGPKAVYSK